MAAQRDHPTEGIPNDVACLKPKAVEKSDGMSCHSSNRDRDLTGRLPHPSVVEQDDLTSGGERISHCGIPVVERPSEVLKKEQGEPETVAKPAVGIGLVIDLQELGGGQPCYSRSCSMTSVSPARLSLNVFMATDYRWIC